MNDHSQGKSEPDIAAPGRSNALLGILLLTVVALLARTYSDHRRLAAGRAERVQLAQAAGIGSVEHSALIESINRADWSAPFLSGRDATGDSAVVMEKPGDGLYVLVRTTCAYCALLLPTIAAIDSQVPGRVTVISRDEDAVILQGYQKQHRIAARVIGDASGRILDNIPDYATPITVLEFTRFRGEVAFWDITLPGPSGVHS